MKKSCLIFALFAVILAFFSCSLDVEDAKTYLVFSQNSRAAEKSAENLTNISLSGKSNAGTLEKSWEKWSELLDDKIELEADDWTFTLSAELESVKYSATASATIEAGKENAVSFVLKKAEEKSTESETSSDEPQSSDSSEEAEDGIMLKTGSAINSILTNSKYSSATSFAISETTNASAVDFLDEKNQVPVWLEGTSIKYYVPSGEKVFMNADCSNLFDAMTSLVSIDLSDFDTSKVTNMCCMFSSCFELTNLDLSKFDTSKVTNMGGMFYYCYSLPSLDLSSFDTSKVTNMTMMFRNCSKLQILDLSSFNTSNVTDMTGMFNDCSKLQNLNLSSFDTSNVTNMSYMFSGCSVLTSLGLTSFNTSNVTDMSSMFYECKNLEPIYVYVENWNVAAVIESTDMFYNCEKLRNFNSDIIDKTNAHSGNGGYLTDTGLR